MKKSDIITCTSVYVLYHISNMLNSFFSVNISGPNIFMAMGIPVVMVNFAHVQENEWHLIAIFQCKRVRNKYIMKVRTYE